MNDKESRFLEMMEGCKGMILRICSLYTRNREEFRDLYQDILLQAWRAFDSFRGESRRSTWLYRIAVNTAILNFRKAARSRIELSQETGLYNLSDPGTPDRTDDFARLHDAIRQLQEVDRAIILMYLEELPHEEIAGVIGMTVNNLNVRILRVKSKLRKILVKQGFTID
ncbi:MAG: sigma-70 family RNA polymerase sigma factor [Bacteroidales bacterium]